MAYSAAEINTIFNAVLFRNADIGAINAYANQGPNGLTDGQVRQSIETSAEAGNNIDPVIRLYQGAFNRVPDVAGLRANVASFQSGTSINQLAQNFLTSQEGLQRYGSVTTTTTAFVDAVFGSALNRTGSASEYAFYVSSGKSPAQVLAEISNSGEAGNKSAVGVINFLDSEAGAALTAAGNVGSPANPTLQTQGTLYASNTLTTSATDALIGTQAGDTFFSTAANSVATDTIDGKAGVDTFNLSGATGAVTLPVLNNVEIVNLVGDAAAVTANFANVSGLSLVTVRSPGTTTTPFTGGGDTITVKNGVVVSFDNVTVASTGAIETVVQTATSTFGSVAVSNGTNIGAGVDVQGANLTTLNVLSTGSAGNTKGNVISSLLSTTGTETSLVAIGDRNLTINALDTTIATVDGTGLSGNLKLNVGNDILTSAKLGSGADNLLFGASTTNFTTATVDGGAGLNTIGANVGILNSGTGLLADGSKVANFQILEVQDAFTAGGTFDLSKVASLTSLQLDAATTTGAATAFNGLTTGGSINFANDYVNGGGGSLSFGINGAASNTNDTETVFFSKGAATATAQTVGTFSLAGVENVNLNVRNLEGQTTTIGGIVDTKLTTITLQATAVNPDTTSTATVKSAAVTFGSGFSAATTSADGLTTTGLTKVDASGYNSDVIATNLSTAISSKGASFLGGSGALTAVGGTGADAFTAGSGAGTFTGGQGADTYNLALATKGSTINIGATVAGTSDSNVSSFDSAFGFHTGAVSVADTLSFGGSTKAAAVSGGNTGIAGVTVNINNAGLATVNGGTGTLNDTVTAVRNYLDATTGSTAAFVLGADSYVVHAGTTVGSATDDSLVKLVGLQVTGVDTGFGAGLVHVA